MKSINSRIAQFCTKHALIPDQATLIIGLSGGPDSVFLLQYFAKIRETKNLTLIAAHLDHEWRPESAQDAHFCQQIADRYKVPIIIKKLSELPFAFKANGSKEEIGRKARRFFFESVAKEYSATAIALAHHADDQAETFFIRMMRGASLAGLVGMKPKEGKYIRPLLALKKQEILDYLHENGIAYVTDSSNQSNQYLRNRIRHSVIPALQQCDTRFDQNFSATHAKLQETEEFLQDLAQKTLAQIGNETGELQIDALLALHPVLRNRVIINWLIVHKVPFTPSQGLLDEIVRFLEKEGNGCHTLYGKWNIEKESGVATISLTQTDFLPHKSAVNHQPLC